MKRFKEENPTSKRWYALNRFDRDNTFYMSELNKKKPFFSLVSKFTFTEHIDTH